MTEKEPKSPIFSDETTLDLPPGYKTVTLQMSKISVDELRKLWDNPNGGISLTVIHLSDKINEIIDFINKSQITVTGNEEFLEQFKDWIQ